MANLQTFSKGLRGLSFSIPDLMLIGAWAEARGLRMAVRLDHGSETEEYEEVLVFHAGRGRRGRYIMWHDGHSVFVQPLIGRARRYPSVIEAMMALTPSQNVVVTDVVVSDLGTPGWPDRN